MSKKNITKATKTIAQASDEAKIIELEKLKAEFAQKRVEEFNTIVKEASERLKVSILPVAIIGVGNNQGVKIPVSELLKCQITLEAIAQ